MPDFDYESDFDYEKEVELEQKARLQGSLRQVLGEKGMKHLMWQLKHLSREWDERERQEKLAAQQLSGEVIEPPAQTECCKYCGK